MATTPLIRIFNAAGAPGDVVMTQPNEAQLKTNFGGSNGKGPIRKAQAAESVGKPLITTIGWMGRA